MLLTVRSVFIAHVTEHLSRISSDLTIYVIEMNQPSIINLWYGYSSCSSLSYSYSCSRSRSYSPLSYGGSEVIHLHIEALVRLYRAICFRDP